MFTTVTVTVAPFSVMLTCPLVGLNVTSPKEYPTGAVGKTGSLTWHTLPVGIPGTLTEAPANTSRDPAKPAPQSYTNANGPSKSAGPPVSDFANSNEPVSRVNVFTTVTVTVLSATRGAVGEPVTDGVDQV